MSNYNITDGDRVVKQVARKGYQVNVFGFEITSRYKGGKEAPWGGGNYNMHIITVRNIKTGKRTWFEYWASIAQPECKTYRDIVEAFESFISSGLYTDEGYQEFLSAFGYEDDSHAKHVYKLCIRAGDKLRGIFDGDTYELAEAVRNEMECWW